MKILVTGNMGYIGPVVGMHLRATFSDLELIGYDSGYFSHSLTGVEVFPEVIYDKQYFGDIRDIQESVLCNVDAVVHLSAISNDPMGNQFEAVTNEINLNASVGLVELAIKNDVKNFVFASSCSMYGSGGQGAKKESDPTNPLTAYARSKIGVENAVSKMNLGEMNFTSLRFATACGMSNRLRLDLVLNDFVASALLYKKISVLSDGSPWRPLIDVQDMARAIEWGVTRPLDGFNQYLAINIGKNQNNFQVKELANAVAKEVGGVEVEINSDAQPDLRSYRVDFSLFEELAPNFQPKVSLEQSIRMLKDGIAKIKFQDESFRNSEFMRLNTIKNHLKNGKLDERLRWNLVAR